MMNVKTVIRNCNYMWIILVWSLVMISINWWDYRDLNSIFCVYHYITDAIIYFSVFSPLICMSQALFIHLILRLSMSFWLFIFRLWSIICDIKGIQFQYKILLISLIDFIEKFFLINIDSSYNGFLWIR